VYRQRNTFHDEDQAATGRGPLESHFHREGMLFETGSIPNRNQPPYPMNHAKIPFRSLYSITEWKPAEEALSFLSDIRDLGLEGAWLQHEQSRASSCRIFVVAGPEDDRFGPAYGSRPHWSM